MPRTIPGDNPGDGSSYISVDLTIELNRDAMAAFADHFGVQATDTNVRLAVRDAFFSLFWDEANGVPIPKRTVRSLTQSSLPKRRRSSPGPLGSPR